MSLRSLLSTKRLVLLFLACFLVSAYFNGKQWKKRVGLQDTERTARLQLQDERQLQAALKKAIAASKLETSERPIRSLDEELIALVISVKGSLPGRMMTVSSMTVARSTTSQKGTSIGAVSTIFPRTNGLKVMTLNVTGTYQNLRLLQEYVARLKAHPLILTKFDLDKNLFTLQIHLIGK